MEKSKQHELVNKMKRELKETKDFIQVELLFIHIQINIRFEIMK